uniref:uncharacterized protein LOC120342824 n=1 Tax=Styela clava TaxID=7725 RepID=UPI00193A64B6|nr:uncharacterized protein LOC120342824 [Styela clava]
MDKKMILHILVVLVITGTEPSDGENFFIKRKIVRNIESYSRCQHSRKKDLTKVFQWNIHLNPEKSDFFMMIARLVKVIFLLFCLLSTIVLISAYGPRESRVDSTSPPNSSWGRRKRSIILDEDPFFDFE